MQKISYTIFPYQKGKLWFFDDPSLGLTQEALTDGVPEVIAKACRMNFVEQSFFLTFSCQNIGKYFLDFVKPLRNGNLYVWKKFGMKCWFCPALLLYFPVPPRKIWFSVFSHKNI